VDDLSFAYGSNLNAEDLGRWCATQGRPNPGLEFVSTAVLPDHELAFTHYSAARQGGVLDVRRRRGQGVEGAVYRVPPGAWATLDAKEGAPNVYERVPACVIDPHGVLLQVYTYRIRAAGPVRFVTPRAEYLNVVARGLSVHGLSEVALQSAAQNEPAPWLTTWLFVYGTLMSGQSRAGLLSTHAAYPPQPAQVLGTLYDLDAFPGLVLGQEGSSVVHGELVRLRDPGRAFEALDQYEGFPGYSQPGSLYLRTLANVMLNGRKAERAWCYVCNGPLQDRPIIPSGRWRGA